MVHFFQNEIIRKLFYLKKNENQIFINLKKYIMNDYKKFVMNHC